MVTRVVCFWGWVALTGLGCSATRGLSRHDLGLDQSPSAPDLEGKAFVSGVYAEGRFEKSDADALTFAWSGSRLSARFSGTTAAALLDDPGGRNQFAVLVDGQLRKDKLAVK